MKRPDPRKRGSLIDGELTQIYEDLSHSTVWQAFSATADRLPDKVAVVDGDVRLTYSQLREEAEGLARGLSKLGLAKGSVAAVYVPNSAELVTLFYALQKLGVVIAWVNPNYREHELRFILENSGAQAVCLFEEWQGYDCLSAALSLEGLSDLRTIVVARPTEGFASDDERVTTYSQVLSSAAADDRCRRLRRGERPWCVGRSSLPRRSFHVDLHLGHHRPPQRSDDPAVADRARRVLIFAGGERHRGRRVHRHPPHEPLLRLRSAAGSALPSRRNPRHTRPLLRRRGVCAYRERTMSRFSWGRRRTTSWNSAARRANSTTFPV